MWIGEAAAGRRLEECRCETGMVSAGGVKPQVVTVGEAREAALLSAGAIYIPKAGDEVLTASTDEGQCFILGRAGCELPPGAEKGEVIICGGSGGVIKIRGDGTIELSGSIKLTGSTDISGTLTINGSEYAPPATGGGVAAGGEAGGA